ncbi:transcription antitermination factor NusB [Mycoplasmopsis bovirhinis]|uniref:transcription antitermination factor NusB n=1 Tax=Mycoplasmopsis bovirhinis TaxID=29553 RepID=UPI001F3D9081|nr:transcription antitermination factor NusB [Mycoplasmopsis bovirhinis]
MGKRTRKQKTMRQKRIDVISEIYTCELLEQKLDYQKISLENLSLDILELRRLKELEQRYDFIVTVFKKIINTEWDWQRVSPLVKAILINAANEFWTIEPKIVINEAVEITKLFFNTPEEDGIERIENRIYKFVNGLLENFYKFLIKLEAQVQTQAK